PVRGGGAAVPAARRRGGPARVLARRGRRPVRGGAGAEGVRGGVAGARRAGRAPAGIRGGDPGQAAPALRRLLVGRRSEEAARAVGVPGGGVPAVPRGRR